MTAGNTQQASQGNSLRKAMTVKHGDKIFVVICVLIFVEISTFSRIYIRAREPSTSTIKNQDSTRRASLPSDSDDENATFSSAVSISNSYIRSTHHVMREFAIDSTSTTKSTTTTASSEIKPRIFVLGNDYSLQGRAASSITTSVGRVVEALGDLDCCVKDPFDFIKPIEKPFFDECTPMVEWQTRHYPTCNMLHEMPLVDDGDIENASNKLQNNTDSTNDDGYAAKVTLINTKGSWRSVWKVITQLPFQQQSSSTDDGPQEIVLKTLRYNRDFDEESFSLQQVDNMAMERLTSSPYIANQYGFCGASVLTEFAPNSGRDLIKSKRLKMWQRLQISHDLAAALSDMHSIDYPNATNATLTHNDINIANTIQGDNGRIKFNDFNIGVLMRRNKTRPCGSPVRFQAPLWRAPEEIVVEDENTTNAKTDPTLYYVQPDKSDIYALGNLLFQVLTTHQPWTWLEPHGKLEVEQVIEKKLAGELPYIPSKFHKQNKTSVQAMYYSTLACFARNPADRPTSYQLAEALRKALEWTREGANKTKDDVKALFDFRLTKIKENDFLAAPQSSSITASALGEAEDRHRTNNTERADGSTPTTRRYGISNKTKELLHVKNKQVEEAEAARRTVERRNTERPKIGIHYLSPTFKLP